MSLNKLRIATRKSPLALWQANYVKEQLYQIHEGIEVELIGLQTKGDQILDTPLAAVDGRSSLQPGERLRSGFLPTYYGWRLCR